MSWLLYSLAAMALLAASTLAARALASGEPTLESLLEPKNFALAVAFVTLSAGGALAYILALREPGSKTAAVAATVSLNIIVISIASAIIFKEALSTMQIAGIALALVSVVLLSLG